MFNADPNFVSKEVPLDEQRLRTLLCLDQHDTDYYLRVYVSLLAAFPDIMNNIDDSGCTYSIVDFPPRGVTMDGGELMSQKGAFGYFTDLSPADIPVNLTYEVRYASETYVRIVEVELGGLQTIPVMITGTNPNKVLQVEWPEFTPFTGPIRLNQTWGAGAKVTIHVQPSGFPFTKVARKIAGDSHLMHLLANAKLVDEFTETQDHQRRVAIALMLLARENTAVYPEPVEEKLITTEDQMVETV